MHETGSLAAAAGVAEVNDSVTLAPRNNNIITVRAIFHLSSLTPELAALLSLPTPRSLVLARSLSPSRCTEISPAMSHLFRNQWPTGFASKSQEAAGLISTRGLPRREERKSPPAHILGPASVNSRVTNNPQGLNRDSNMRQPLTSTHKDAVVNVY